MKKNFARFTTRVQNWTNKFQMKFKEAKEKPKSKRKSFIIGFTTILGIFGLTVFGPALSAVAKDTPTPNVCPAPTDIVPANSVQTVPPTPTIINASLSGLAASVCSLAITSGSFAIGVVCGCIVVIGILQLEKK